MICPYTLEFLLPGWCDCYPVTKNAAAHICKLLWGLSPHQECLEFIPIFSQGKSSQHLIAVRRYKSLAKVPVSCFRLCARELIYSAFSFMLQRFPNNYTQAAFHLKTILTSLLPFPVLFLLSLKGSPNKSLAQGGNVSHFITLHFVTLHKYCTFFTNWRFVALSNSISTVSPTAFVHLTSLCSMLVRLTVFQMFYYYLLQRSMIRDLWCTYWKEMIQMAEYHFVHVWPSVYPWAQEDAPPLNTCFHPAHLPHEGPPPQHHHRCVFELGFSVPQFEHAPRSCFSLTRVRALSYLLSRIWRLALLIWLDWWPHISRATLRRYPMPKGREVTARR